MHDPATVEAVLELGPKAQTPAELRRILRRFRVPRTTYLHWLDHPPTPPEMRQPRTFRQRVRAEVRAYLKELKEGSDGSKGARTKAAEQ